jgi:hypothetical protein
MNVSTDVFVMPGTYNINVGLTYVCPIRAVPYTAVFRATAAIDMLDVYHMTYPIVKGIRFDMNNTATRAIYWRNSACGDVDVDIIGQAANSIGLDLYSADTWAVYFNKFKIYAREWKGAIPAGSKGIYIHRAGGQAQPNNNTFYGEITYLAIGIDMDTGYEGTFITYSISHCTTGFDIGAGSENPRAVLINPTFDASTTDLNMATNSSVLQLHGWIGVTVAAVDTNRLILTTIGPLLYRGANQVWRMYNYEQDMYLIPAGKGLIVTTPDGLHTYRIRVTNAGVVATDLIS